MRKFNIHFIILIFLVPLISACASPKLLLVYKPGAEPAVIAGDKSVYVHKFTDSRPESQKKDTNTFTNPGFESKFFNDQNTAPRVSEYVQFSIMSEFENSGMFMLAKDDGKKNADYALRAKIISFNHGMTVSWLAWPFEIMCGYYAAVGCYASLNNAVPSLTTSLIGVAGIMGVLLAPVDIKAEITVDYELSEIKTSKVILRKEFSKTVKNTIIYISNMDYPGNQAQVCSEAMCEVNKAFLKELSLKFLRD